MSVERIQQHFHDSAALHAEAADALSLPIAAAVDAMFAALANGNKIVACGDGPSAAAAHYLAVSLVKAPNDVRVSPIDLAKAPFKKQLGLHLLDYQLPQRDLPEVRGVVAFGGGAAGGRAGAPRQGDRARADLTRAASSTQNSRRASSRWRSSR